MKKVNLSKSAIELLCEKYKVEELYVFGSAVTGKMTDESDIDFLVKFKNFDLNNYFLNYLELKTALEMMTGRKVDLIEKQTLKNPFLIQSIEKSKELLYG
ncbi:nucleotidyltransferase family protein [Mongoliitalea daihaiensis]|uniref:nucleotidyltransferase family protein n=1 Tax=Mongoliitalea daihaiensis TaxID=2782006 RepID=UPI001F381D2B|nr:nucleotidyltransferase domain-containing protein [Mongoliitalea daihaiensis]UJP64650.1 nucleotidyltransferase domain-containing protein [Mongoliitalea daihaiensis]